MTIDNYWLRQAQKALKAIKDGVTGNTSPSKAEVKPLTDLQSSILIANQFTPSPKKAYPAPIYAPIKNMPPPPVKAAQYLSEYEEYVQSSVAISQGFDQDYLESKEYYTKHVKPLINSQQKAAYSKFMKTLGKADKNLKKQIKRNQQKLDKKAKYGNKKQNN